MACGVLGLFGNTRVDRWSARGGVCVKIEARVKRDRDGRLVLGGWDRDGLDVAVDRNFLDREIGGVSCEDRYQRSFCRDR